MASDLPNEYTEHLPKRGFICEDAIGGLSGMVVRATQENLGRPVAIKFCDSADAQASPQLRARFEREARLLARIQHPAIPHVLTTGKTPQTGTPYTVLEFIEGVSLRRLLDEQRKLEPTVALRLLVSLLDALDAVHALEIVHRDVKPENIIVTGKSCVLIDFSIGYSRAEERGLTRATRTGEHLGTVDYMCPEQRSDMSRVDGRCDLYSVGIVLHEMMLGTPHVRFDQLDADMRDVAVGIRSIVRKACAQSADDRFQNAKEFVERILPFTGAGVVLTGALLKSTVQQS